jgi:hypothetical protein
MLLKETKLFAGILILVLLSSCSTILRISRPVDPEIRLGEKGNIMVVQNHFNYTNKLYIKEKNENVYSAGISSFTQSLISYLSGSDLINAIEGDTLVKSNTGRTPSDILSPGYVVTTCNNSNANMMLSIDSLYIDFDWETEVVEDDDGSRSKTKYFYLQLTPFLSLYNNEGTLLDRSYISLELPYSSRPALSGLITIKPALQKAKDEVIMLSSEAGENYGSKFFETLQDFPYIVYLSKPFDVSYRLIVNGNYADAIRNLLPLAESTEKKVARRAAYNLCAAYTGLGDLTSAEMWADKANSGGR